MQTTIVGQVTSSVVAVASISDQNGIILVDINPSPYSNSSTVKALQPQLQKAGPGTGDGKVIVPGIAVTSVNNSDGVMIDYYTQYTGNGSIAAGWPQIDKWISFVDMYV